MGRKKSLYKRGKNSGFKKSKKEESWEYVSLHRDNEVEVLDETKDETKDVVFDEEPIMIYGWEQLVGLKNDKYYLDIDLHMGSGRIESIESSEEWLPYLSTHTFYGKSYKGYELTLRQYGFNVRLANWDTEDEYERARIKAYYDGLKAQNHQ